MSTGWNGKFSTAMLGPQRMNPTRWIAMKFGTDIYVYVRINYGNALIIIGGCYPQI